MSVETLVCLPCVASSLTFESFVHVPIVFAAARPMAAVRHCDVRVRAAC